MRLLIVFVLIYSTFFNAQAQLSKTHFIPPITTAIGSTDSPDNSRPGDQFLHISTPTVETFSLDVTLSGVTQSYTLNNTSPLEIPLGAGYNTPFAVNPDLGGSVISNSGIIINAENPVYASVRLLSIDLAQAGSLVSKGLAGLGTDFRAGTFTNLNTNTNGLWLSFISVMATENGTVVDFTDIDSDVDFYNNATNTSSVALNSGDVYIISCVPSTDFNGDAFIGARITSNKNVVVNSGSTNGSNDANNAQGGSGRDYGIDQIAPLNTISQLSGDSDYIFVRGNGSGVENIERPIIVANEDNTKVYVGGNLYTTLQLAGDYVSINESSYSSSFPGANMYVYTDKTTYAYQGIGGRDNRANQELFFVPPLSCKTPSVIDNIPAIELVGSTAGASFNGNVTVVTRRFKKGSTNPNIVKINGVALPLSLAEPVAGTDFDNDGNSDYVTYLDINLNGDVSVSSNESIYVSYFGANGSAAMGGFYSGFIFKSEISSELEVGAVESCIDNINKLELSSLEEFDTYQWYYKSDSNSLFDPIVGATNKILDFNNPPGGLVFESGFYQLEGIILDADGITICERIKSSEIPISECPGDTDNDGVNNNIDIDIDNDGISNVVESDCNLQFDLSTTTGTYFDSSQFTNSFANGEVSQGFSDQSILLSASAKPINDVSEVTYELEFNQPTSFAITQAKTSDAANAAIDDNEYFSISVPASQTLSVYDPDDQLLIDTNYDGIYEQNTIQFTSFEIRFKLNGINLNNGQGTFEFRSRLAPSLKINYSNSDEGTSNSSAFRLNMACRDVDSDLDGVYDLIDLDTDNDGIYDVIESGNSNLDTDNDGRINDVEANDQNFDGKHDAAIAPENTDGDSDADYLDKDSDGDFIWDVVEGGNHDLDLDLNGVIDASLFQDANSDGYHDNAIKVPLNSDSDDDPDYIDIDSDNDGCPDGLERGDPGSSSGIIPLPLDTNGDSKFDYQEYVKVATEPLIDELIICEKANDVLTVILTANSSSYNQMSWQFNRGTGWNDFLTNNPYYQDVQTLQLKINEVQSSDDGMRLRARFSRDDYFCSDWFSEEVLLKVNDLPEVLTTWTGVLIQCDEDSDGKSQFNLLEAIQELSDNYQNETFEFYTDILDSTTLISNPDNYPNTSVDQLIQVKIIDNISGCFIIEDIVLTALSNNLPASLVQQNFSACYDYEKDNAIFNFSSIEDPSNSGTPISINDYVLNSYNDAIPRRVSYYESYLDALLEQNQIQNLTYFEVDGQAEGGIVEIWIRVDDDISNSCNGIKNLIVLETLADTSFVIDPSNLNPLNPIENEVLICNTSKEDVSLILNTESNITNLEFEWVLPNGSSSFTSVSQFSVQNEGDYQVKAYNINDGSCVFVEDFIVRIYKINEPQLAFFDIVSGTRNNSIKLLDVNDESVFGENNYEFMLIDEEGSVVYNYQELCDFDDLTGGIYRLFVRDEAQCDEKSIEIPILYFPTYITPNGDGFNDNWQVKGIDISEFMKSQISIYNRYGKLLSVFKITEKGWDGTINGNPMPTDDYWFKAELIDASGNLTLKRGHFSLLK